MILNQNYGINSLHYFIFFLVMSMNCICSSLVCQSLLEHPIRKVEGDVTEVKRNFYNDIEIKSDDSPNLSKGALIETLIQFSQGLPIREVVLKHSFTPNIGTETLYYYNPDKTLAKIELIELLSSGKKHIWKSFQLQYEKGVLKSEKVFYGSELRGEFIYDYSANEKNDKNVDINLLKPSDKDIAGKFHIEYDSLGEIIYTTKSVKNIVGEIYKVSKYDGKTKEYIIERTQRGMGKKRFKSNTVVEIEKDIQGNVIGQLSYVSSENPKTDSLINFYGYVENIITYGNRKDSDIDEIKHFITEEEIEQSKINKENEIYIPSFNFEPDGDAPYKIVEDMPRFPGCEIQGFSDREKVQCSRTKLQEYISGHIKYPNQARINGQEGKCVVQFVVNTDGTITDIKILRSSLNEFGKEAVRIFKEMNGNGIFWRSGKHRGRNVRVNYTTQVEFNL